MVTFKQEKLTNIIIKYLLTLCTNCKGEGTIWNGYRDCPCYQCEDLRKYKDDF